jgi:hypothetical protein
MVKKLKTNDVNFVEYCLNHYSTPIFHRDEFINDMNKTVVLKKMFRRYLSTGIINDRLVLNNIITMINVFGIEPTNIILFFKLDDEFYPIIKSFLTFLNSFVESDITKDVESDKNIDMILKGVV